MLAQLYLLRLQEDWIRRINPYLMLWQSMKKVSLDCKEYKTLIPEFFRLKLKITSYNKN